MPRPYNRMVSDSRLVYSTDGGDRRKATDASRTASPTDGIVRVSRETTGRRGKTVTLVRGLPADQLRTAAGELKRLCGTGGAVKQGVVELQGDHRDKVLAQLRSQGHRAKLAGG